MEKLKDCIKKLSNEDIEKIILSRYNVEIDPNNYEVESAYIKEAICNMTDLNVIDNDQGMVISLNWIFPEIDYDQEKIICNSSIEPFYIDFDAIKDVSREKWYEYKCAIEGLDWHKVLGSKYYYEGDMFDNIEPIIHELVAFGNNADDCLANAEAFFDELDKQCENIQNGNEETYTYEEVLNEFNIDKHDEIFEKMKEDYDRVCKECLKQNNDHLIKIIETYNKQDNKQVKI